MNSYQDERCSRVICGQCLMIDECGGSTASCFLAGERGGLVGASQARAGSWCGGEDTLGESTSNCSQKPSAEEEAEERWRGETHPQTLKTWTGVAF